MLVEMATGAGSGRHAAVVVSVPVVIHRWATASRAACLASSVTIGDGADGPKSLGLDIEIFAHR